MHNNPTSAAGVVTLEAQINVDYHNNGLARAANVHCRVHNRSQRSIGVLSPGSIDAPQPSFKIADNGDLTVSVHMDGPDLGTLAVALPNHVERVDAGDHYERRLTVTLLSAYVSNGRPVTPKRLRVCQGYLPFDASRLAGSGDGQWLAPRETATEQSIVCSAWLTLGS